MPRGRSNLATVPVAIDFGQPSTRLQRLLDSAQKREPYALTDTIIVQPPNRNARKRLDELSYSLARTQTLMHDALRRAAEDPPEDETAAKDWETRITAASEEFRDYSTTLEKDNTEWITLLLGDAFDSVDAFLGEQEPELYDSVIQDIREHFQSPLGEPDTGVCPKCGHVTDEDAAGKDTESST